MNAGFRRAALAATFALVGATALQAQSVLLRLNPEQGLVSRYVTNIEAFVESPMMPATNGPMMTGEMYQTQRIVSVEGDVFSLETTTDSATMATPGMPGMQNQIPDPAGQSQTMKMDSRGRIVEMPTIEGVPPEAQQMMAQMGNSFGLELPEGEVGPGDSWSANFDIDLPGQMGMQMTMAMDVTYTLERIDGDFVTLAFTGPMIVTGGGQGMTMDGDGTIEGTMVLDVSVGRINRSTTSVAFDMNASGMTMSMRNNMNMTLIP